MRVKTSRFKGVHFCNRKKKWIATFTGKKYLGQFTFEQDAHDAYQKELNKIKL